jgi:hypothetical protein
MLDIISVIEQLRAQDCNRARAVRRSAAGWLSRAAAGLLKVSKA